MYDACKFNAVYMYRYFKNGYLDRIETAQPYNIEHQLSFEVSHNKIGITFIFSNFWVDLYKFNRSAAPFRIIFSRAYVFTVCSPLLY